MEECYSTCEKRDVLPRTPELIADGRPSSEISALFDVQIEGIMKRIRDQLDWLSSHGHPQQVVRFVLQFLIGPYLDVVLTRCCRST